MYTQALNEYLWYEVLPVLCFRPNKCFLVIYIQYVTGTVVIMVSLCSRNMLHNKEYDGTLYC